MPYGTVGWCGHCRRQETQFTQERDLQEKAQREAKRLQEKQQEGNERLQRDQQQALRTMQREQASAMVQQQGSGLSIPAREMDWAEHGGDSLILQSIGILLVVGFASFFWYNYVWNDANLAAQGRQMNVFWIGEAIVIAIAVVTRRVIAGLLGISLKLTLLGLALVGAFLLLQYMGLIHWDAKTKSPANSSPGAQASQINEAVPKTPPPPESIALPSDNTPALTLRVVNIRVGDFLALREGPDSMTRMVFRIPPNASGMHLLGAVVNNDGTKWIPVEFRGAKGFVNSVYVQAVQPAR